MYKFRKVVQQIVDFTTIPKVTYLVEQLILHDRKQQHIFYNPIDDGFCLGPAMIVVYYR
jgi:hypothetical protein